MEWWNDGVMEWGEGNGTWIRLRQKATMLRLNRASQRYAGQEAPHGTAQDGQDWEWGRINHRVLREHRDLEIRMVCFWVFCTFCG